MEEEYTKNQKTGAEDKLSRRSFILKAGVPATVLSVSSKSVFAAGGAICNISGFQSISPSGVVRKNISYCGGYTPRQWRRVNKNGNIITRDDWLIAGRNLADFANVYHYQDNGFIPNPAVTATENDTDTTDAITATTTDEIFGTHYGDDFSLHDALYSQDRLLRHATATFLNACLFRWGLGSESHKIFALDVVGLYQSVEQQSYTTRSGTIVKRPSDRDLTKFFKNTQH